MMENVWYESDMGVGPDGEVFARRRSSEHPEWEDVDPGPDARREMASLAAMADPEPPQWWYLSFVDPDLAPPIEEQRPGGPSWLGACYVRAANVPMACAEAWDQGCNPGGSPAVMGPLTDEMMDENVPPSMRNRLLSLDEVG